MQKEENRNQVFMERSILEKLPGGYHCCANEEGFPFLHISKEFLKILGWTKAEIQTRFENRFLNMIHPDDRELALAYADKMCLPENENQYQNQIYRLAGKNGYHWVSDTSMWAKQGEESVFQCFIFDITEYIQAQEKELKKQEDLHSEQMHTLARELERSEKKLKTEMEYLKVICRKYMLVYYVDLEADMAKVLRLDEHSHVWQMKELRPGSQFAYEDHLKRFAEQFIVQNPQEFQQYLSCAYITYRLKNQCRFTFRYESSINLNGNCHYEVQVIRVNPDVFDGKVIIVSQEIDDVVLAERQQEERLLARAEYADFANRSKTEFISQVAHDIRTPMNSIFGFLEIAEANIGDWEKVQYSLEKIRVAGEFLKDLADDVLDVSRMEKGKLKLQPEEMNLRQLLEEFSISMQNAKFDKKQKLYFNIYHILHENIIVDPLRLKQIYANVFSNAIKYTPDGGLITFDVHQEEIPEQKQVCIITTITDTGIGMSEEFMGKMFSKFERAVDTRVNSVSGYGLGLSIVKQLVDLMQGTIEVQSKLNEGTSVCIKLTVPYVEEVQIPAQTEKADYAALCKGMHLLVAEDNELNREVITELLDMYSLSCDCAEDGAVCVERFRNAERGTYDAILMDMQMPNMNGVDAAMQIRALPLPEAKTIPIIAMTANALKEDVQKCLDAGMNQHLSKPVDMVQLLRTLAETMQSVKTKK